MTTPRSSSRRLRDAMLSALLFSLCFAAPATAATLDLIGPAGATVSLNDRVLGTFPLDGALDLPPGRYTVRCTSRGYQPYENTVRLVSIEDWQRVTVRLMPLSRQTAWSSNILLAGLGQHYLGHSFRGYLYNAAELGGLLTALAGELQRDNLEGEYLAIVALYERELNGEELVRLGNEAEAKYTDMQDMASLRDLGLIVAGGAIVLSAVDALLSFPSVAGGTGHVPVATSTLETPWNDRPHNNSLHAAIRLEF